VPHLKPRLLTALLLTAAALLAPATSHAGTASMQYFLQCDQDREACVSYEAVGYEDPSNAVDPGPAEDNTVTLTSLDSGDVSVRDETAPVVAGYGCELRSAHEAWCESRAPEEDYAWWDAAVASGAGTDVVDATDFTFAELLAVGGPGDDVIVGTRHDDELRGGDGNDVVDGREGSDRLAGGGGIDTVDYGPRGLPVAVTLGGSGGTDLDRDGVADEGGERDALGAIENAIGGEGPDTLVGNSLPNVLRGGPGGDTLDGGAQGDVLDGESGADTISYATRTASAPVAVTLDGLANDGLDPDRDGVSRAGEERDRDIAVERATGGAGADRLTGSAGADVLAGGPGMDRLDGGFGADTLDGGTGLDTAYYGLRGATQPVAILLDGVRNDGADPNQDGESSIGEERDRDVSIENATGGAGPDLLRAQLATANILTGNGGADRLLARDGGAAVDHVNCGAGADSFQADAVDAPSGCETALP
jgi:Ca2+-binding RTX toxin-like protein